MTGTLLKNRGPRIVMVAGEASGDLHGARVAEALRRNHPHISICGAGGHAMAAAGVDLVVHSESLSVMGFTAIIKKLPVIYKAMARLKRLLASRKPDVLILVDFPDFNLHLASQAKKLGIPVLYYISPTVWAWRAKRINKIKARINHMAVILPFEKQIYEKHRIPVTFVGHPLLDNPINKPVSPPMVFGNTPFTLALLPGSREGEVKRLLPSMLEAVKILQRDIRPLQVVISRAHSIKADLIEALAREHGLHCPEITDSPVQNIFERCHFAVIASGTASLEGALSGIPMVIVYKTSAANYLLGNLLIKVPHIGLANLIAGKRIVPELVQEEASAEHIARNVLGIVHAPDKYQQMRSELMGVRQLMGKAGAADQVALIADRLMGASMEV